jgi:hypothetical protein
MAPFALRQLAQLDQRRREIAPGISLSLQCLDCGAESLLIAGLVGNQKEVVSRPSVTLMTCCGVEHMRTLAG